MMRSMLMSLAVVAAWTLPLPAAESSSVDIQVARGHIDFLAGGHLVTRYHTDAGLAKPYFWPINGPDGVPLTRAWPMQKAPPGGSQDHPHQKSAWFCHGDIIPEGLDTKGVDFWSEAKGHGRIVVTNVGRPKLEKDHGQVTTHNEWQTATGQKILDETRTIHLYNFGKARLLLLDIVLKASVVPLAFGDTKEGSLGVRINDRLREEHGHGTLENARGQKGEKNCWGRLAAWCDYSGTLDGHTVGLAILDDPRNPYPACWHSRGYGLMAANPFGRARSGFPDMRGRTDLVKLAKGEQLRLRYSLLIHPGNARTGQVAEYYRRFKKLAD
jgi:hypothetical protein